jgi:hypothetical protein
MLDREHPLDRQLRVGTRARRVHGDPTS